MNNRSNIIKHLKEEARSEKTLRFLSKRPSPFIQYGTYLFTLIVILFFIVTGITKHSFSIEVEGQLINQDTLCLKIPYKYRNFILPNKTEAYITYENTIKRKYKISNIMNESEHHQNNLYFFTFIYIQNENIIPQKSPTVHAYITIDNMSLLQQIFQQP